MAITLQGAGDTFDMGVAKDFALARCAIRENKIMDMDNTMEEIHARASEVGILHERILTALALEEAINRHAERIAEETKKQVTPQHVIHYLLKAAKEAARKQRQAEKNQPSDE